MAGTVTTESGEQHDATGGPAPRGRGWKLVPIGVVAFVILLGAIGAAYALGGRDDRVGSQHAGDQNAAPRDLAPRLSAASDSYALPPTLDRLPPSDDDQITSLSSSAVGALSGKLHDLTGRASVGTYATDPPDAAILIGLPANPSDPNTEIANAYAALDDLNLFDIAKPAPVSTPLAGAVMQCADAALIGGATVSAGICVESDAGGSVVLVRLTKSGAATAQLTNALLATYVHR